MTVASWTVTTHTVVIYFYYVGRSCNFSCDDSDESVVLSDVEGRRYCMFYTDHSQVLFEVWTGEFINTGGCTSHQNYSSYDFHLLYQYYSMHSLLVNLVLYNRRTSYSIHTVDYHKYYCKLGDTELLYGTTLLHIQYRVPVRQILLTIIHTNKFKFS